MRFRHILAVLSLAIPFFVPAVSAHAQSTLSAAGGYTCLNASGDGYCWGDSGNGVMVGDKQPWLRSRLPKKVVDSAGTQLRSIASISAGYDHACAMIHSMRDVYCWGSNMAGALGNGTTIDSIFPVPSGNSDGTTNLSGATQVSSGLGYSCAVIAKRIACWGYNIAGELGNNSTNNSLRPFFLDDPADAASVSASFYETCATSDDGYAKCWGDGYLGNNAWGISSVPISVLDSDGIHSLANIVSIVPAEDSVCALLSSGEVVCWGNNTFGELGTGTGIGSLLPVHPIDIFGKHLGGIVQLVQGANHACALKIDSSVVCWGYNRDGQLGIDTKINSLLAANVKDPAGTAILRDIVSIAAGDSHTCALKRDGSVWCWGDNAYGQLGNGKSDSSLLPVQVDFDTIFQDGME